MSLQYIIGSSGSGKSTYIYEKIVKEAIANPKKKFLVIVPEQYTMATQRLLVDIHPKHCIMNIDVLSFNRLAYRVFDELGISTLGVLDDTGKSLVLRSLVPSVDDNLGVLKSKLKRPGYIAQLKSLISEMTQYQITPDILKSMIEHPKMSLSFKNKAKDLLVMYEAFLDYNATHGLIAAESILSVLNQELDESDMVVGSTVVFDGFTGFTPIQYELFGHLLKVCEEVYVTLTIDSRETIFEQPEMEDLFAMSKNFARRMNDIAKKAACEIIEPYRLDGTKGRLYSNKVLNHLEGNLFRKSYAKYQDPSDDNIAIWTYQNSRAELLGVATEIQKLIRSGVQYKEIAVVCASLDAYRYQVTEVFDKLKIPYFIDAKSSIVFHPLLESIGALFAIFESGFGQREVFRFLRCGFTDLSVDEINLLENYVIASGIRGKKKYFGTFAIKSESFNKPEDLEYINDIRSRFVGPFMAFDRAVGVGEHSVKEIAVALYELIVAFDMEKKTYVRGDWHESFGRQVKAKEYKQIYKIVMDLLDKMVAILGEERMGLSDFYDILNSGINSATIGVIPPAIDSVVIGDMERTRLGDIKVLFLLGASDTAIPKPVEHGGILSQLERQQLLANDFEMAPSDKERAFIQRFYLYLILTKPSDKLYVFFPSVDSEGKEVRKSYLVDTLLRMFSGLSVVPKLNLDFEEKILSESGSFDYLTYLIQKAASEGVSVLSEEEQARLSALLSWYENNYGEPASRLIERAFLCHENDPIADTVKDAINQAFAENGVITGSVSRFETYAGCGYRYFLQYVLGLTEREEYQLSPIDIGNFYHAALELFGKLLLEDGIKWKDVNENIKEKYIEKAIVKAYEELPKAQTLEDEKQAYIFEVVKETLRFGVDVLLYQVKQGSFEPAAYESVIKRQINDPVTGTPSVVINGKVDRIDIANQGDDAYVRIVDYKSSEHSFDMTDCYYGTSMQLPIYLGAVMEKLADKYPNIKPSGLMYYQVDNPFIKDVVSKTDSQLMEDRIEAQRMNGLVAAEKDMLALHDAGFAVDAKSSSAIKVNLKKDGTLTSSSMTGVSSEDFTAIVDYSTINACDIADRIKNCEFDCTPSSKGGKLNCDKFCPYKAVCHFNPLEEGFTVNELVELDDPILAMKLKIKEKKGGQKDEVE